MYPFIEIKQVTKKIDNFTLGPVNLTIETGTVTAFIGDNGSGKSTLIKMIMNLVHPTEGEIVAFGHHFHDEQEIWKEQIAYLPQTSIGYDAFNGTHLKKLVSRWYPNWDNTLFNQIVADLNIPLTKTFSKLSQGVQQKLLLALTIPRGTKLLILDEPMTFLDIPSKKYFTNLLIDWLEQDDGNRSIILASHQADDIKKLADYIFIIRSGEAIGLFEKDSLIERFERYWIDDMKRLPPYEIPGEEERDEHSLLSSDTKQTEAFLREHQITWNQTTPLDLEEIIAVELSKKINN